MLTHTLLYSTASMWGNQTMIEILLENNDIDVNCRNKYTGWTALHAATFQENGKVVRVLLKHGANPMAKDLEGRTPKDYASISENVWPFFADLDLEPTSKKELLEKRIVRKLREEEEPSKTKGIRVPGAPYIKILSRPGSSYGKCSYNPIRPMSSRKESRKSMKKRSALVSGPL